MDMKQAEVIQIFVQSTMKNREIRKDNLFGLISLFKGISTFAGYLMPKPSLKKSSKKLVTEVDGNPKDSLLIATTPTFSGGATLFPGLLHFTLDKYLIMLSVKQGGIKYHF